MRKYLIFYWLCSWMFVSAQETTPLPPQFQSISPDGKITLKTIVFDNKKNTVEQAGKNAIEHLLFEGIPEATKPNLQHPFIENKEAVIEAHPDYFKQLLEEDAYLNYLYFIGKPKKVKYKGLKKKKAYEVSLTIHYKKLFRELRRKKIVQLPGF